MTTKEILRPYFCGECKKKDLCNDNAECIFFKACDNLEKILEKECYFKSYRAFEGDVRVVTCIAGDYKRYTIKPDGTIELKL